MDIYKVKIRLTLYVCWIKRAIDDDENSTNLKWKTKKKNKKELLVQQ